MRLIDLAAVGALAALGLASLAAAPVPRPSPELAFAVPAGPETPLASFKGKVVVVEFLLVRCPHCWRLAKTLAKLEKKLGPRGFQPVAVAFDPDLTPRAVSEFQRQAGIPFPVGSTTPDRVDGYLGREPNERFQVPQLVVIDRAGTIRAQSHPTGETSLEDEKSLHDLIAGLLKEKGQEQSGKRP